jgi:GTP1/Obg family GTP-binding protein
MHRAKVIGLNNEAILYLEIRRTFKMKTVAKISPEDYILSVLSPEERLEAAFKIAKETFKKTTLTVKDIENAVKKIRKRAHEETQEQSSC